MAVILGKAFGISASTWMNLQKNWELSQVSDTIAAKVAPISGKRAA
jgi:plasmid maintenance system antidote protein VapI